MKADSHLLSGIAGDPATDIRRNGSSTHLMHVHFEDTRNTPTLREKIPFDPAKQAELLHDALKTLVAKNRVVMQILTTHNNLQRQKIAAEYKNQYHKDLITVLKHELNINGHYEQTLLALMMPPAEYDAHELHHALSHSRLLLDEATLIEILCSRDTHELHLIRNSYHALYHKDLEQVVKHDTKGDFEHFLLALLSARREKSGAVDVERAAEDAKALHNASITTQDWGHPESLFIDILAKRSYVQLYATFQQFERLTGHEIEKSIHDYMKGDVRLVMSALVKFVRNKHAFFAECLYEAVKGRLVNDRRLIRIIVRQCEKDLEEIKIEFANMYGHSLQTVVKSDTSGNYRQILLALAGYDHDY